ncbi:hypothetical protein NC981_01035 [Leptolyngbya sp. DQ-M1]|uniref:hypothetical protein n=1 Tax=Leptolyngbya sp. DQ-M1 TaxID=2933920 RepID=UPI003299C2CC
MAFSRVRFRRFFCITEDQAVWIVLILIWGSATGTLLLSKAFPDSSFTATAIIFALFGAPLSFDMVNALVKGAIERAKDEGIQKYKATQTSEGILEQQDIEYYAVILPAHRNYSSARLSIRDESLLEQIKNDALASDEVVRRLGDEDELLVGLANWACRKELGMDKASREEIRANQDLERFRKDVFMYLKAWLMLSIKYRREMRVEDIKQRYPNEAEPNKYAYLRVLRYIRDYLIDHSEISGRLEEKHRERGKQLLKDYLTKLIQRLEKLV